MPQLSVFLPVYNEEEILAANTEKLLGFLSGLNVSSEVILGSNGSTDRTSQIGQSLAAKYPQVQFFHLAAKGPGAALREALRRMQSGLLICLDMDLPVPLDFIARAAELLKEFDIVIGAKRLGNENRSLYRRTGSDLYVACSKRLIGLEFDDYSLGAKGYRKEVLQRYEKAIGRGTFYVQHIIYLAHRDGRKISQIAVDCADYRRSRFNLLHEGFYRFGRLFTLWLLGR